MQNHASGQRALANNRNDNFETTKHEGQSNAVSKGLKSMAEYQPKNSTLIEEKTVERYIIWYIETVKGSWLKNIMWLKMEWPTKRYARLFSETYDKGYLIIDDIMIFHIIELKLAGMHR